MIRPTVVQAEATRLSELLSKGRFEVPWHQRYYDWTTDEVRELLEDLREAVEADSECYFLGAVILVANGSGVWQINDGQQRMVTVSLISAAFCRRFAHQDIDPQREMIALQILFDLEPNRPCGLDDSATYERRIRTPRADSVAYQQMIRGRAIGTNGKLTAAWQEIDGFLGTLDAQESKDYFDYLIQRLEVACLYLPPEVDPNAVYESINARGRTLDDLDRLRNHFYSYFGKSGDGERREGVHEALERVRTVFSRGNKATAYVRCRLQCTWGFLRGNHLYRDARSALRKHVSDVRAESNDSAMDAPTRVSTLVEDMCSPEAMELFRTMTAPNLDPEFAEFFDRAAGKTNCRRSVSILLHELRTYKVTHPLVFALLERFVKEPDGRRRRGIARVVARELQRLAAFVLRTTFVRLRFAPSEYEERFANFARSIAGSVDIDALGLAEFLHACDRWQVLDDRRFIQALDNARMKPGRQVIHLLRGVNRNCQDDWHLLEKGKVTLEHVLPAASQHWSAWEGFRDVDCEDWVDRVGNLTLMGPTDNRAGANFNRSFRDKAPSYGRSSVAITRALAEAAEWTPEAVEARQREIARKAAEVWAFP